MAEVTASQSAATAPTEALDDLDRAGRRRRTLVWVGALCAALVGTVLLAVGLGPVGIAPGTVVQIIGHHVIGFPAQPSWAAADDNIIIIWLVRLPRVLLGVVVGAALAATGVAIQALVRNVLADPFLLGTASGASTGAAGSILFGLGASLGLAAVSVSAFVGALAATALVFATARIGGRMTSIRLVLAGIAVAYALSTLTSFLIFAHRPTPGGSDLGRHDEHRDNPHASRRRRGGAGDTGGDHVTADGWDLLAWIVLSRVHDGGVTRQGDHYLDRGEPAPDYLAGPFARLTDTGALALADPDPTGHQQVTITDAGRTRYSQLRSATRDH